MTEQIRVIAILDEGSLQQQIVAALGSQPEFVLVDILNSIDRLSRDVSAADPDMILIDHTVSNQPTLDIIDDLALQFPESAVIAILPENDPVVVQQVFLAGARGFIIQPFTQINLLSTLRRVEELESRRKINRLEKRGPEREYTQPVKTITFFSPRGGSGCTTLATNLAIALFNETGQRVLLMDGKFYFGHLDVMLNIRSQNTIGDLLPHANNLDEGLVSEVVVRHASGIDALLAPTNIQVSQGIRPDDLYSVYIGLQRYYDYIVIDAGSMLSENAVTLMDAADRIMLVAIPDLASLHDVSRFIQLSRTLGYPPDKLAVVINRDNMIGGVRTEDVEVALRHNILMHIGDDAAHALRSINRGVPIYIRYPRSPVSRGIKQLAKSILGMNVQSGGSRSVEDERAASKQEALLASSRLG